MANPEHVEVLDKLDELSVCVYRSGITLFAISLLLMAVALSNHLGFVTLNIPEEMVPIITTLIGLSGAMCSANLHVYDKKIRMIITWSSCIGLVLLLLLAGTTFQWIGLGFIFVTFSGIAVKEAFCFKVPGLRSMPWLLCLTVILMALNQHFVTIILLVISASVMLFLAVAKWRMPLHFDIGDKSNYQI
ncbi:MAG: hypothetical protein JKY55_00695 [Aliivibrio sp.]|uniref:DUF2301 domain-containing membrane protein n=1 Tax=Aliivibrio sp. TaxID=1872443 RepID=UPI001A5F005C|nr:hypothetical protein [Aliivibrio sp.]